MKKSFVSVATAAVLSFTMMGTMIGSASFGDRDPNGDGQITMADSTCINQYLVGATFPSNVDALDFDENGIISRMDSFKIMAVDAGLEVSIGNAASYGVETELNDEDSADYYVYNASTGARITSADYTINGKPSSKNGIDNTDVVIGSDDRVIDWTKSGVAKLMCSGGAGYLGTGFVVDDHTIATAAHCVVQSEYTGKAISSIKLFNSNGTVALSATPLQIHVPKDYFTSSAENDYALITVYQDISNYVCFDLGVALDQTVPVTVTATGFPQYVNNTYVNDGTNHNMYSGTGSITSISTNQIFYNADTSSGNSGCPIYVTEASNGNLKYTVIAIHRGGSNAGTRINGKILRFYYHNPNI